MAKKLEEHLYRSAQTKDEYIDQTTLKKRLQMIAHGLGVPKSGASTSGDSSYQAGAPSAAAAAGQGGQVAQLQAMQGQPATGDAQSAQAQQQLKSGQAGSINKEALLQQLQQQQVSYSISICGDH
jgi:hypothetical protein